MGRSDERVQPGPLGTPELGRRELLRGLAGTGALSGAGGSSSDTLDPHQGLTYLDRPLRSPLSAAGQAEPHGGDRVRAGRVDYAKSWIAVRMDHQDPAWCHFPQREGPHRVPSGFDGKKPDGTGPFASGASPLGSAVCSSGTRTTGSTAFRTPTP